MIHSSLWCRSAVQLAVARELLMDMPLANTGFLKMKKGVVCGWLQSPGRIFKWQRASDCVVITLLQVEVLQFLSLTIVVFYPSHSFWIALFSFTRISLMFFSRQTGSWMGQDASRLGSIKVLSHSSWQTEGRKGFGEIQQVSIPVKEEKKRRASLRRPLAWNERPHWVCLPDQLWTFPLFAVMSWFICFFIVYSSSKPECNYRRSFTWARNIFSWNCWCDWGSSIWVHWRADIRASV